MPEPLLQYLANASAALVGALTAGAIGFYFALRRFRHEKAFERRLEWHERTVQKLTETSERLRKVAVGMQVPQLSGDLDEEFEEALDALPNFQLLLLEATMYASRGSYRALATACDDWGALALSNVQILNTSKTHTELSDTADRLSPLIIDTLAKSMLHAASRLASDVRATLRLGRIGRAHGLYSDGELDNLNDPTALERARRIRSHKDFT